VISNEDGKTILSPPLTEADVRGLKLHEQVYVSGVVHVARDLAHKRIDEWVQQKKALPFDLQGAVLFHAGPTVTEAGGSYRIINIGPTTSARMNRQTPLVIACGVRAVVGKGAMDDKVARSMAERGCVFLAAAPGCALIHAARIRRLVDVKWIDLGTTEAVWILEVDRWGPLTVAMDAAGGNLFQEIASRAKKRMEQATAKLTPTAPAGELDTELLWD
jgi:fumarate hydratase subunit beta